jgi:hypothetical protein
MSLRSVYSAKAASIVETGVSDAGSITSVRVRTSTSRCAVCE